MFFLTFVFNQLLYYLENFQHKVNQKQESLKKRSVMGKELNE